MKLILNFAIILTFLGSAETGRAQAPYFQHYFLLKKNEPVQVQAIFQDRTGLMWYGTNKGLFKFDGINFQRFTSNDSLPDESVTAIAEDSLGRIWAGHKNGRIAILEKGIVRQFEPAEGSSTQEISDILFDRHGNLWFSTLNDGLYYHTLDRLYRLDEADGMPDLYIYDIEEDSAGRIWVGTDGGVGVCTLRDRTVQVTTYNYQKGLPDNIIKKIVSDESGTIWLGTEDAGIVSYDPATGRYKPMIADGWKYGVITDFIITGKEVWISSLQTGLVVYDRKEGTVKTYSARSDAGLSSILVLFRGLQGNIWAGTKTDLIRTGGDEVEFIDQFEGPRDLNTVAVVIDRGGSIWFANGEGLFRRRAGPNGQVVLETPLAKTRFEKYSVISLYEDSSGAIWAGLYGEGVLRINPSTGSIRYVNEELRNGNILHITGSKDVVWLATLGGGTKIRFSGDHLDVKNYTSKEGLISDYIYQVFVDSRDRVWFATDGKGVDMMDEKGFHHYQDGLNSKVVYGFVEDRDHHLWINAQGDGIYQLEGERFKLLDPRGSLLRDNNISCFSVTPSGNLFVMHDLGIDIYDTKTGRSRFLGDEVGIHDMKPNLNAVAQDAEGHIAVGTDGGILLYSDQANGDRTLPQPIVEALEIMNRSRDLSGSLSFPYNENDVTVRYLGLWYQNPTALHFQYRLENYDREWIGTRDHAVTYSSLPPGDYTFQLKTSETEDFTGSTEASVGFTIRPPFWQTLWFYTLSLTGTIFLIYSIIQYRERTLRHDKRVLEERVEERTIEIIRKNEEIHKQAEEIRGINENLEQLVKERTRELEQKNKALAEYAFINAHELRAPVASILGLVSLMQNVKLEEEELIYLTHLKSSAEKLDGVVRAIGKAIEKGG